MKEFRTDLIDSLPPGAKIKEIKEVHQNGTQGFYAIVQFKQLKDLEDIMKGFAKKGLNKNETGKEMASQWSVQFEKKADKTAFTQKVFVDVPNEKSDKTPDQKVADPSGLRRPNRRADAVDGQVAVCPAYGFTDNRVERRRDNAWEHGCVGLFAGGLFER